MLDMKQFEARLTECEALTDKDSIARHRRERIRPKYADQWPQELHPRVRSLLANEVSPRPYKHQAEAIRGSLQGADIVLESSTASGKTLAFVAPILDSLQRKSDSRALLVYPTKALAQDQLERISELARPLGITVSRYDGDTSYDDKRFLRANLPRILVTNPEYLNLSFLGWRNLWPRFLGNLCYMGIDEMHEYTGFFGTNMALLMRRFLLQLHRKGVRPRLFLSTATCANPAGHARTLTGRDVSAITAGDALRPKRYFLLVAPHIEKPEDYGHIFRERVENAALAALREGLRVLVFCPSKRMLDEAFHHCQAKAAQRRWRDDKISAYHADLTSSRRQEVQNDLKAGRLNVVFTTNALELGIDIGELDGIIMAGFPADIGSAWQQIGRAGRSWEKDVFVLFYATDDPIDRLFVRDARALVKRPFDHLVADPDSEKLIADHLPSLVEETGGQVYKPDEAILGASFFKAAMAAPKHVDDDSPQLRLKLRGSYDRYYKLVYRNSEIGQIPELRRFREAYTGASFTFFGHKYRVHSCTSDSVLLEDDRPGRKTYPEIFKSISPNSFFASNYYGSPFLPFDLGDIPVSDDVYKLARLLSFSVHYGRVDFTATRTSYYEIINEIYPHTPGLYSRRDFSSVEEYRVEDLHAFWITFPDYPLYDGVLGAIEQMMRIGALLEIRVDKFDANTWARGDPDGYSIFYYENVPGGMGVAKKLFEVWPAALARGVAVAESCKCGTGCVDCLLPAKSYLSSNAAILKGSGVRIARALLALAARGPDPPLKEFDSLDPDDLPF